MAKGGQTAKAGTGAQMKAAWKLFDAGDKRAARDEAARVLADPASSVADAEEARELLARLKPPPFFRTMAIIAACLIAGLIALAVLRG